MFRNALALVSVSLALTVISGQTNYCNSNLCPAGVTHIACNNNGVRRNLSIYIARLIPTYDRLVLGSSLSHYSGASVGQLNAGSAPACGAFAQCA